MADLSKATARPWAVAEWSSSGGVIVSGDGDSCDALPLISPWCEEVWDRDETAMANAALIVKAVNLHGELVVALREAEESLTAFIKEIDLRPDGPNGKTLALLRGVLAKVDAP